MEFLELYRQRLQRGQEIHQKKFNEIKEARQALKQRMPDSSIVKLGSSGRKSGNDKFNQKAKKSKYMFPIYTAVAEKIKQDLTASPFRFQWEGNTAPGVDIKDAFENILLKIFTYDNSARDIATGLSHAVVSGTMITQTTTRKEYRRRIKPDSTIDSIPVGRTIPIIPYDPLTVILDWNAEPSKVAETSDFIIVTIGVRSLDFVKKQWGEELAEAVKPKTPSEVIDNHKRVLEQEAGTNKTVYADSVVLREYYTADGYRHVIANDEVLLESSIVSNGMVDRIPFDIAPIWDDPDSVYGMTLWNLLEPSIQVINTALNQILDSNALNAKMPFFTFKGALKGAGLTLNDFSSNEIIELDPKSVANYSSTGSSSALDIQKMITKLQFPDITQAGIFLFETALKAIWFVTGLNPESLGGIQEKQIRNEMVAGMIQQSALRNSSKIVQHLENNFMNPTCWHLVDIFEMYYDDFPEFAKAEIPREFLKSLKEIRVVNGSYLPADKSSQMEKAQVLLQRASMNGSYDHIKVEENFLKQVGFRDPERWFRPAEEMLQEQETMRVMEEQDSAR